MTVIWLVNKTGLCIVKSHPLKSCYARNVDPSCFEHNIHPNGIPHTKLKFKQMIIREYVSHILLQYSFITQSFKNRNYLIYFKTVWSDTYTLTFHAWQRLELNDKIHNFI